MYCAICEGPPYEPHSNPEVCVALYVGAQPFTFNHTSETALSWIVSCEDSALLPWLAGLLSLLAEE